MLTATIIVSAFCSVEAADLIDKNNEPRNIRQSLVTDVFATTIAGLVGSSPGTAYIESAIGMEEGDRTGLTAGLLFFHLFLYRRFYRLCRQ